MNKKTILLTILILLIIFVSFLIGKKIFFNQSSNTDVINSDQSNLNTNTVDKNTNQQNPSNKNLGTKITVDEKGRILIYYTDKGFNPSSVTIPANSVVKFINNSEGAMRMANSYPDPKNAYRGFGQDASVPKGGTYIFRFSDKGVWMYKNLNSPQNTGEINVI
ncbi:MAG: hypothetical protein WCW87_01150 [Candidatus Paceibacterota bacterium]